MAADFRGGRVDTETRRYCCAPPSHRHPSILLAQCCRRYSGGQTAVELEEPALMSLSLCASLCASSSLYLPLTYVYCVVWFCIIAAGSLKRLASDSGPKVLGDANVSTQQTSFEFFLPAVPAAWPYMSSINVHSEEGHRDAQMSRASTAPPALGPARVLIQQELWRVQPDQPGEVAGHWRPECSPLS